MEAARVVKEAERAAAYKWWALLAVAMGTFINILDTTSITIALPTLGEAFGVSPEIVVWVYLVVTLTGAALLLTLGRLGDTIGRKRLFTLGCAIFTIGLGLCGLSQNIGQLLFFRVVQAVGGAMLLAVSAAIVTEAFPGRERGKALGIMTAATQLGLIVGPSWGGFLIDNFGWRAIFLFGLPLGAGATTLSWAVLRDRGASIPGRGFDVRGAVVLGFALISLPLTLTWGPRAGWGSLTVLGLGGVFFIATLLFIAIERVTPHPIVDLSLFKNRLFTAGNASLACH